MRMVGYVLASSITDIYYIIRRLRGSAIALVAVQTCLGVFRIIEVGRGDLEDALQRLGSDFEDNLQIACAVRDRIDAIITRDPEGFRDSPIPALSPAEAVQRLNR